MQRLKDMEEFKEELGVMDSLDAAKMLGIEVSTFRATYIKFLREKSVKCKGVLLFRKQDILALREQFNSQNMTKIQQGFEMLGLAPN